MATELLSWVVPAFLLFLTFLLARYNARIKSLPPGPFPLPVLGNILAFRGEQKPEEVIRSWKHIYGNVFTVWLGSVSYVVVCGWGPIREALVARRSDFSGRPGKTTEEKAKGGNEGILHCDYGLTWKSLRKITKSAIRRYATSERLARIVCEATDDVLELILEEQKKAFDPKTSLRLIVTNIISSSLFGKRYKRTDEEFLLLDNLMETIIAEFASGGNLGDFFPFLKIMYREKEKKIMQIAATLHSFVDKKLQEHLTTFQTDDIRDLTDSLIAAKADAERDARRQVAELKDANLVMVLVDLLMAGIMTTNDVLRWTLLLICNFENVQEKMHSEITDAIGDRIPHQADRKNCPFTEAVIMEAMRFKPPVSFGMPHKATCHSQIGGFDIPKGTNVVFIYEDTTCDTTLWPDDPTAFRPERFLHRPTTAQGFVAFGEGQRRCVGEKLAMADIFLIICRLIQMCHFQLENGPGTADLQPCNNVNNNVSKPYKVTVTSYA